MLKILPSILCLNLLGLLGGAQAATPTDAKQWSSDRPALNGTWQIAGPTDRILTADGAEPPLLPAAKAAYAEHQARKARGDVAWDPVFQCNIHGTPRIFFENMPFEVLQTPKRVFFVHQWNREFRIVDLDVQHSEPPGPTYFGQSVGRWEGDTLVVDTTDFNNLTYLDAAGMPHSDKLHLIERLRVVDGGKVLEVRFRLEDPETFSKPWEAVARFIRRPGVDIEEDICVQRLGLPQYQ